MYNGKLPTRAAIITDTTIQEKHHKICLVSGVGRIWRMKRVLSVVLAKVFLLVIINITVFHCSVLGLFTDS